MIKTNHLYAVEESIYYPNYNRSQEMCGSKYCFFLGNKYKKNFYAIPMVSKTPCIKHEEWLTKKEILAKEATKDLDKIVKDKYGTKGEYYVKYLKAGTNLSDNITLWASGKKDLIAMNLVELKQHLAEHPEDSYFFFNPNAKLEDVQQLEFGLCSCEEKPHYDVPQVKSQELEETILKDVHKHLIEKEILKCYLNDAKNVNDALVLINLPQDILNLSNDIANKIEIMCRKPDQQQIVKLQKQKDITGKLKMLNSLIEIIGFKINFINDKEIQIFGIIEKKDDHHELTETPVAQFKINHEQHMTSFLIKSSNTAEKKLFAGKKEKTAKNISFSDEDPIDLSKMLETNLDRMLFLTYSFKIVKDTIKCFFDKIGIIKNGGFFICEHASQPYVVYSMVVPSLSEKIKQEEKANAEKEQRKIIDYQKQEQQRKIIEATKTTVEITTKAAKTAVIAYGVWTFCKWGSALLAAVPSGGTSLGLASVTP